MKVRSGVSADARQAESWPTPSMRPEAFLLMLMFVVLVVTVLTVHALWHFQIHGYLPWPFG